MASQPTVKRIEGHIAPARKRGRPQGAASLTPEEKRLKQGVGEIDYVRSNNVFQQPADFYKYLGGYPDKTGLMAYVYRLKPITDVTLIGESELSILKTVNDSEMSEDHIGNVFGRGVYKLTLNDANRPKGQREVAVTYFDLSNHPSPPKYDPRCLVLTNPKNLDEINRLLNVGIMVRDRATGTPRLRTEQDGTPYVSAGSPQQQQQNPFGQIDLGQVIVSLIDRGSKSPHETVKDTIEIARLLSPAAPPVDLEAVIERVAQKLRPSRDSLETMLANYEKLDQLFNRFRPKTAAGAAGEAAAGAAGGGGGGSWAPHLQGILMEARSFMPELIGAIRELRASGPQQNGVPNMPQQPQTPEQRIEMVARVGFQKMREGVKGFDYASFVCSPFFPGGSHRDVYELLEPGGAAGFIGMLAMNPQGRAIVNDPQIRPQLEAFLDDFFMFSPDPVPEESESAAG